MRKKDKLVKRRRKVKKNYITVKVEIIKFIDEEITTASVVVGGQPQPGEEIIDGSEIFDF